MKRIIAKVLMIIFPAFCAKAYDRIKTRRAEMQTMLDRARIYRDVGYTTSDINQMMRSVLEDYERRF